MKKSVLSLVVATLAAMSLTGCGDGTKLETGTFACTDNKDGFVKYVFDMENSTWDMRDATNKSLFNNPLMQMTNSKTTIGTYNEKTKEYELITEMEMFGVKQTDITLLKRDGDKFEVKHGTKINNLTCKKEED